MLEVFTIFSPVFGALSYFCFACSRPLDPSARASVALRLVVYLDLLKNPRKNRNNPQKALQQNFSKIKKLKRQNLAKPGLGLVVTAPLVFFPLKTSYSTLGLLQHPAVSSA